MKPSFIVISTYVFLSSIQTKALGGVEEFFTDNQKQQVLADPTSPLIDAFDSVEQAQGSKALEVMNDEIFSEFRRYDDFDAACELRGFFARGDRSLSLAANYLRTRMRRMGDWDQIVDTNGENIYRSTFEINAQGEKIPTTINPAPIVEKEIQNARVDMSVSFASEFIMTQILEKRGKTIVAAAANRTKVKALGGTVARPGGIRSVSFLFPDPEGWFFYAVSYVNLRGLADGRENAASVCAKSHGIFDWINESLN